MKGKVVDGLLDFDVAIESLADGYRARVVASPAGEAHADFALPFTGKDLEILILKVVGSIGRARRRARRIQSDERRLLEEFGGQLFQAVFCGPVRECLGRSRLVAQSRGAGLRIRLRLPGALANVPWEYLYDSEYGFIGLSPETALVRYVELAAPVSPLAVSPPLRILAMISAPVDVLELQGDEEWGKLADALGDLAGRGMVQVDRLETGTLAALQRPLRLREYHVLHFVGHGYYDDVAQDGALALEGLDRKMRLVTGRDLGMMIRGHRSLRLVVLNACEGARSAGDDPLGGVAQALVRQGIPAVVAMQFEISDPAALVFSKSFYQAIADDLPVDVAMVEARKAMFAEGHEVEWATPVLYLRSPDGRVFWIDQIPDAGRQAREDTERRDREEADRQAREDADRQAREDADRQAREDADRQAREEAERQAREEAERQARQEAERQAREETERLARKEAERQARQEAAELGVREEAERQARQEAERLARDEAERRARQEAQRLARDEAERQARQEAAELGARDEAERRARQEAERLARDEAERQARQEAAELGAREERARSTGAGGDPAGARDQFAALLPSPRAGVWPRSSGHLDRQAQPRLLDGAGRRPGQGQVHVRGAAAGSRTGVWCRAPRNTKCP